MDRWGPRRIISLGIFISGLGLILLSRINVLTIFYASFVLVATGMSTATSNLLMAAVAKWFRRRAGFVMGITASGVSFGGLLLPLVTVIIDTYGWRQAMIIMGLGMWSIPLPLSLLFRHKPEQYGYLPDGEEVRSPLDVHHFALPIAQEVEAGTKEALTSPTFWIIATASLCHMLTVAPVMTHIMPYLSTINIERPAASLMASALPVLTIVGRVGFGWLGDQIDKRAVAALAFSLTSLGALLLGYTASGQVWVIAVFVVIFSIGWGGAVPMLSGLLREYFGRERLGTIIGCAGSVMMVGQISGPPLAGWIFDHYGYYQPAWYLLAGVMGLASILFYGCLRRRAAP
jgi:MFS family permease